jgi:large conductance mechanosensitive channel
MEGHLNMIKGFKEFIARGNVIDLAVAVVIGAAFSAVVTAVVDALINPLIGAIFNASSLSTSLQVPIPTLSGEPAVIGFGAIIAAVINFLIIALVVYFVFVYPINRWRERSAKNVPADEVPAAPSETELLIEIRDLLAKKQ